QAQLIEVRRIVVRDSAAEHKAFPRARRNFKPLQLANDFERPMFAPYLCTRSQVLPAQQPIHELRSRDRLDLLAQGCDRQAMNPSQQTPLAPLGFGFYVGTVAPGCPGERSLPITCARISRSEFAAQNRSAGFHAEQGFL